MFTMILSVKVGMNSLSYARAVHIKVILQIMCTVLN